MKFLIVEDDPISSELLKPNLSGHGQCYEVTNGLLAVEVVRNSLEEDDPFDAIFLDIMMPEMNGHEVLAAIREAENEFRVPDDRRTKVVMVSALGDPANITSAIQAGCDGYIIKPLREENLHKEMTKIGLLRAGAF